MNKAGVKQTIRELRAIARKHGYSIRYYTYSGLKDCTYVRNFTPQFPAGEFDRHGKRILIRKYRNTFHHAVMCVLAHEVGHVLHMANGSYPRYYSDYWTLKVLEHNRGVETNQLDISCFLQGVRAERDCDKWAQKFLRERGYRYTSKMNRKYPASMVMGYSLYEWWMTRPR